MTLCVVKPDLKCLVVAVALPASLWLTDRNPKWLRTIISCTAI